jgi:hypothetical protein
MVQLFTPAQWRSLPGFGSSMTSGGDLERELKIATEGSTIDVPDAALLAIVQASYQESDRRVIMRHLATCLNEPKSSRWRRIYLAIHVLEQLLQRGSPELISETLNGHHFDFVQRMSFLEQFMFTEDDRVRSLIRRKAASAHAAYAALQQADAEGVALGGAEAARTGVKKSGAAAARNRWHNDDTTDDESGDEQTNAQSLRIACPKAALEDELTTDVGSVASSGSSPAPTPLNSAPVNQPDLLDLLGGHQAATPDLLCEVSDLTAAIPSSSENLLDF